MWNAAAVAARSEVSASGAFSVRGGKDARTGRHSPATKQDVADGPGGGMKVTACDGAVRPERRVGDPEGRAFVGDEPSLGHRPGTEAVIHGGSASCHMAEPPPESRGAIA